MNEIEFRQIENSNYFISNIGILKTINWKNSGKEEIMKPAISKKGYLKTVIVLNGKNKSVSIHRLVAQSFITNPENKPLVNHKNCIKTDNRVENLEWVTAKENVSHAIINNKFKFIAGWNKGITTIKGEQIGTSKLTEKDVIEIRKKFIPYKITRKILALEYNISELTVKDIILGRSWKYLL